MNSFERSGIPEGTYTETIYGLIKEQKYAECAHILSIERQSFPRSRAALSLLAYCQYQMQDFTSAASTYEQLVKYHPDVVEYRIYLAQSLYKAGMYPEAIRASMRVDSNSYSQRMIMLQAAIKFQQDDVVGCKALVDQCQPDDPDTVVNQGAILYKEGQLRQARERFAEAMTALGYQPHLAYNIALCHYRLKQYGPALKHISDIIERGVREHPELSVGSNSDSVEVRSVGNSQVLHETALVEAFNLKAAIESKMKNEKECKEAMADMPPRSENELDPVTLHNTALFDVDSDPNAALKKLNFLLQNPPFPPETFRNLLLLYCRHQYYAMAADVMAENAHLTYTLDGLFEYLDAMITVPTSPEEAYRKFDALAAQHIEGLRKLTKSIQDARSERNTEAIKESLKEYDDALERYIPVLMGQARIYWDMGNYGQVEVLFRQAGEFCSEHDTWKLNVGHMFFMQAKYREAIHYYEPLVNRHLQNDNIIDVTAIVLANLCVSYIMTSQNERAEELMRKIEDEERRIEADEPDRQVFHLCIVNLVIGTLYCSKGNFEFGMDRIIKSFEPFDRKLSTDTWFYAKRCLLSMGETLAKNMIMITDESFARILDFLDSADRVGKDIRTVIDTGSEEAKVDPEKHNVSFEARQIKRLYLRLRSNAE